jgi:L-arabinokinase
MNIAFYISGHGLGHISRQAEVIKAILRKKPDTGIYIRTKAPAWFIEDEIGQGVFHESILCDTGVRQVDSLELLKNESLVDFKTFYNNSDNFYSRELKFLKNNNINSIVTDFSPWAMELAARAGIPCKGIANFCWDYIYEPYTQEFPEFSWIPDAVRKLHAECTEVLRLPFNHEFKAFKKVTDIPMIARISHKEKDHIRKDLGIPENSLCVLLSFGGFSIRDFSCPWIKKQDKYHFIACETSALNVPGLQNLDRYRLKELDLEYCDLVKASDCVITKPGYGILTDCIANDAGMIYTWRGEFREYDILVKAAEKYLKGTYIPPEKLKRGEFEQTLGEYFGNTGPLTSVPANGADMASDIILQNK